jgi:hypothetical protein
MIDDEETNEIYIITVYDPNVWNGDLRSRKT